MEILSFGFAKYVVKIAFCVLPIVLGVSLFLVSSEKIEITRRKISKKLLGDPNLLGQGFYNFVLYFIGSLFILMGLLVTLLLFL